MTPRRSERPPSTPIRAGRETDLRRRPGTREQRTTVLIATNGEATERAYFDGLKQESWVRPRVAVVVERGSPTEVVRGAGRRKHRDDFDEAWAVCDVDEYPTREASDEATDLGVRLAWSNPCFEVWLLLHHTDCTRFIENAKKARDMLRRQINNWDKTALRFDAFRDLVDDACRRARRLDPPPAGNPSSDIGKMIDSLR